jgi:hypothetical protein
VNGQPYDAYVAHPVAKDIVYGGRSFDVTWFVDPAFSTLNLCIFSDNDYKPQLVYCA